MKSHFFVTGTDTHVGKTTISVALIDLLQQQGLRIAGMKPVASGCELTPDGLRNNDAMQLQQQSSVALTYDTVNPYAFEPAIAPHLAAEKSQLEVDVKTIKQAFERIKKQADGVIVEGAGGWFVPLNQQQTLADLAIELQLPIILVVAIRLGCINHALLTVNAIKQSGLALHGWVANTVEHNTESEAIIDSLKQRIMSPCLGVVPHLSAEQTANSYIQL